MNRENESYTESNGEKYSKCEEERKNFEHSNKKETKAQKRKIQVNTWDTQQEQEIKDGLRKCTNGSRMFTKEEKVDRDRDGVRSYSK